MPRVLKKRKVATLPWDAFMVERLARHMSAASKDPNWVRWNKIVVPLIKKELKGKI